MDFPTVMVENVYFDIDLEGKIESVNRMVGYEAVGLTMEEVERELELQGFKLSNSVFKYSDAPLKSGQMFSDILGEFRVYSRALK